MLFLFFGAARHDAMAPSSGDDTDRRSLQNELTETEINVVLCVLYCFCLITNIILAVISKCVIN